MSTKRSQNKIIEWRGIGFVQNIVKNTNCIFEQISLENDQGNDCFIEFISDNVATSFCVFAQIKSGKSYRDNKGYKISANRDHLEYWNDHLNPIAGIVYDEELNKGFWINISQYLKENLQVLKQEYHTIRINPSSEFSFANFDKFKDHFIFYIKEYKSYENFGRSIESFSDFDDPTTCYEGVKSLFSNHRDKKASWFYLISNFRNIKEKGIHGNILGMISDYIDNPHTFWHEGNMKYYPDKKMQDEIKKLIAKYFGEEEVKIALPFMSEGVMRGTFSFLVFLVLDLAENVDVILKKIAFDTNVEIDDRNFSFWLFIHFAQKKSVPDTLKVIDEYINQNPKNSEDYLFIGMKETLEQNGFVSIG